MTKPTGALGRLETYAIRLAGIQRTDRPHLERGALVLFAAVGAFVRMKFVYDATMERHEATRLAGRSAAPMEDAA